MASPGWLDRSAAVAVVMAVMWLSPLSGFAQEPLWTAQEQSAAQRQRRSLEDRISRLESALKRMQGNSTGEEFRPRSITQDSRVSPVGHSLPGFSSDSTSTDGTVNGRLSNVENWIRKHRNGLDKKKVEAAGKPTLKISGRIHADYWSFPVTSPGIGFFENPVSTLPAFGNDPADRFAFRRLRVEMRGDLFETNMWRTQVDFNNPGTPEIKDAWIGFKNLPCNHQLLIGNQKRPLGLDHLNSSRFNVFTERPLVVEAFNEDARRPGITLYGNTCDDEWGWVFGGYLLRNVNTSGRYRGDSTQGSLNARLFRSPWYEDDGRNYFHWAISGMFAKPDGDASIRDANLNQGRFRTRAEARSTNRWLDTGRIPGADWYEILGLEGMLNVGPLQIVGEYQLTWMQRDGITAGTGPDLFFHGAYAYVSYFLTGENMTYTRRRGTLNRLTPNENFFLADWCCGRSGNGWGAWQVALRYSYLDLTDNDITGGLEHNIEFALNWHWTSHSKLQMALIYGDIDERGPIGGFDSGHFLIAGARFAIDF